MKVGFLLCLTLASVVFLASAQDFLGFGGGIGPGIGGGGGIGGIFPLLLFLFVFIILIRVLFSGTIATPAPGTPGTPAPTAAPGVLYSVG